MSAWKAVIITGASRGYGRAIALAFARAATANLHFVLSGRDESGLAQTQHEVAALERGHAIDFTIVPANLSQTEGLERASEGIFGQVTFPADRQYEEIVFINNAGSLGPLAPVGSGQYTAASFANVMHVNVTASCFLTSELIRRLGSKEYMPSVKRATIVNISSLAAVQVFATWGMYCTGKAARDMFHKVLAEEVKKTSPAGRTVSVLNYAPGPMDTDMNQAIRESPEADEECKAFFVNMRNTGGLVDAGVSADKLVRLVSSDRVFSGEHVDFYDAEPC